MSAPAFVTMRLGKDSVEDIKAIDARPAGVQLPPYQLTVTCKQVPRSIKPGTYAVLWLGSDNSKGMPTVWKQGIRAIARIEAMRLGEKHNDDSSIDVSIGYVFGKSIDKIDLIDNYAMAYKNFSMLPLVGLSDYSNQTVREVDSGPKSNIGALIAACGKASASSLEELYSVYPDLRGLVEEYHVKDNEAGSTDRPHSHINEPRNLIFFGAPGTGKSHSLNELSKKFTDGHVRRVTFYPDYTYAQFVGCFKPITEDVDDGNGGTKASITYRYVFGPFLETYLQAVKNPDENYLLIVEEINRANPAAVFGDVFQLLDRKDSGESQYTVATPEEMRRQLEKELADTSACTGTLSIPKNMYIWATMNSADQGVFPMDTAFKRRWDFRYMGIDAGEHAVVNGKKLSEIVVACGGRKVYWNELRKAINRLMIEDCGINEDKLLGPFFLNPSALTDESFGRAFKEKVLLYLFEDAGKTKRSRLFWQDRVTYSQICDKFDMDGESVFGNGLDDKDIFADEGDSADNEATSEE